MDFDGRSYEIAIICKFEIRTMRITCISILLCIDAVF